MYHILCNPLTDVTSIWIFCRETKLFLLPIYKETWNQQQDKEKITIIVKAHMISLWLLIASALSSFNVFIVVEG